MWSTLLPSILFYFFLVLIKINLLNQSFFKKNHFATLPCFLFRDTVRDFQRPSLCLLADTALPTPDPRSKLTFTLPSESSRDMKSFCGEERQERLGAELWHFEPNNPPQKKRLGLSMTGCTRTMSSVAKYMSRASEEKVRNLKATVEMLGFHLVGRPTAA